MAQPWDVPYDQDVKVHARSGSKLQHLYMYDCVSWSYTLPGSMNGFVSVLEIATGACLDLLQVFITHLLGGM